MEKLGFSFSRTTRYRPPGSISKHIMRLIFERSIKNGCFTVRFQDEDIKVGIGRHVCAIEPPSLFRFLRLIIRPDLNVAGHYVYGFWNCEQAHLYDFLELLFQNQDSFLWKYFKYLNDRSPVRDSFIYKMFPTLINRKTAIHYSSNIEFMKTVLGDTLLYTCAFFERDTDTLENAQMNKISKIAERLKLESTDNVLELGCGWGNAAEIISKRFSCRVTGINITKPQVEYAREHASKLTEFVHTSMSDFNPERKYSKIYSIGMLEHIGVQQFDSFFSKVGSLLEDNGSALIHCIVREKPGTTNAWIDKVVFPGGYIPRVSEIINAVEANGLSIAAIHIHQKINYFKTLSAWRANFYRHERRLRNLFVHDLTADETEQLIRMWDFYLAVSQLCFSPAFGQYQNVQIILGRRAIEPSRYHTPLIRGMS